ncbi:MAG: acylphosphatase [Bacteroidota bacterium]
MNCYRIKIYGNLRGTAFRSAAMHEAYRFRISGFIRYDDENSLTIEAQGELNDVNQFIQFCRDWFSPGSIKDFILSEKEPEIYPGFTIRRNISKEENPAGSRQWFQRIKHFMRL